MFYQQYQDTTDYFSIGRCFCREHFHRSIELMYCIKTQKPFLIDGHSMLLNEGELIIVPPMNVHSSPRIETQRSLCAILPVSYSDIFDKYTEGKRLESFIITDKTVAKDLYDHLIQLNHCNDALLKQGIYTYVLAKILKNITLVDCDTKEDTAFSIQILTYIEKHYAENLTQEKLANVLGYNRNYFSSLFKKHVHTSFSSYLNIVRINKAIALLKQYSAAEVAEKVGFNNVQSFYQNFKKVTGTTPTKYLKQS
ncbi:MAG: helix-turn-helix domain-containing protein [Clostridia bacterium]|nr:helix-turn-helix domain-containing protein [Clostridia bacterium]